MASSLFSPPELRLIIQASKRTWTRTKPFQLRRCIATHTHSFHAEQVSIIRSNVDVSSPEFKQNAQALNEAIDRLNTLHAKNAVGGPEKARQRHVDRGKMLPRE